MDFINEYMQCAECHLCLSCEKALSKECLLLKDVNQKPYVKISTKEEHEFWKTIFKHVLDEINRLDKID